MISSVNNTQIKHIGKLLNSAKYRREKQTFVIEGQKMFLEAREHNLISKVYISETYAKTYAKTTACTLGLQEDIEYEIVADSVLKIVSDTITPQGILAIVKMPEWELEQIFKKDDCSILFLENLRDPGNLGTIIRTAEGAGVSGIVLSKESVDLYNPKVVRSTMGSIFRKPIIYVENLISCILEAKKHNIKIYATDLQGIHEYDQEVYNPKSGIIIGNEANGITGGIRNVADTLVKIPMCGKVESLNAGIAAGLMMYEIYRQKRTFRRF